MTEVFWPTPPAAGEGGYSIESGYFILTMMPSLFCKLRCPHCYLSVAQRQDRSVMAVEDVAEVCRRVDAYWNDRRPAQRRVVVYWYGGEPTSMGRSRFLAMLDAIDAVFDKARGYEVSHVVLSALVGVDESWFGVFRERCGNRVQSSFDGEMRGAKYLERWTAAMRRARAEGLRTSAISVVNRDLLRLGPSATMDFLEGLGVSEVSFLPFMLNEQNAATGKYDEYAPTMAAWSDFMVGVTERWSERVAAGGAPPMVGQMAFVLAQSERSGLANVAAQTLFLLPDGEFVLPDYRDGWSEYMRPFGNGLRQDFAAVLSSPARRAYLRRQVRRNGNADCLACPHAGCCVMEFWKPNRPDDDCFGGRRYVEWLLANRERILAGMSLGATLY